MKSARYSTFKEPPIRGSWTTGKIAHRFASNWLLACCCGSCYAGQKAVSTSRSNGEKIPKSVVESQIPSIDSTKSEDGSELAMEEILLTDRNHGVSKNVATQDVAEDDTSLINRKNGSLIDTSDSKSKTSSSSGALSNGTRRVMGSLPVLPSKEKKSASNDEKNVSESDSEIGHPARIFAKCSKRYRQQRAINVPQLIIS